jgi:tripartite motif-containing protein 71
MALVLPLAAGVVLAAGVGPMAVHAQTPVPTYLSDLYNAGGVASMYPAGGQVDGSGTMWIADSGGSRIDEITSGGVVSYVTPTTGPRLANPRNLSLDVSNPSDLWITDTGNNALVEMTTAGAVLERFDSATVPGLQLTSPFGNANDTTAVYIADTYDNRVVALSKTNGAVLWAQSTCLGEAMSRPRDVAIGSDGNLYAVDTDHSRVVELAPSTGACIAAWTGSATGHPLVAPRALVSDGAGGLWIGEDGSHPSLVHFNNAGSTFYGKTTNAGASGFVEPEGVLMDGSDVVVADPFAFRTISFTVSPSGAPSATGTPFSDGGPALGGFNNPFGVAFDPEGDCFVTDMFNQRMEKFNGCTGTPIAAGQFGVGPGDMQNPRGLSVSPDGSTVILTNSEDGRIDLYSASSLTFESSIFPVASTCGGEGLYFPYQSAFDATNDSYWVADTNDNRVVDLASNGDCLENWAGSTGAVVKTPRGIAWDGTHLWVADAGNGRILQCTTTGSCIVATTIKSGSSSPSSPWNLSISNGDLYVADEGASRVVVLSMTAPYHVVFTFGTAGTNPAFGEFASPRSVAVDPVNGDIAVADFTNDCISIWSP